MDAVILFCAFFVIVILPELLLRRFQRWCGADDCEIEQSALERVMDV